MNSRLYMRLDDREIDRLRSARDVVFGASSFRTTIMALCDSVLVERLCLESLVETQLRRISVNLRQIDRRVFSAGGDDGVVLSVCNVLDPLVDIFSAEVSCLRSDGGNCCGVRREISVHMSADEKAIIVAVKRALKFRNFRSLVLGLCNIVYNRIMPPDFTVEYQTLKQYGNDINTVAKALNAGKSIDMNQFNLFLGRFIDVLSGIAVKISEG